MKFRCEGLQSWKKFTGNYDAGHNVSYAANNYAWISCWGSFFIRPDGATTGRLAKNRAGILISTVDLNQEYYDSTKAWRKNAMNNKFHSRTLVHDPRNAKRGEL
ncbi:hypothetical protein [Fictibacillus terranigra]|uniref:Uncharacterized protein n=1 Tax=Fictibacillus terranigra TaxID=3058424 RepID=A0ABT8E7X7_9BACL|nr:hypothetical protein [Fictibacillus sp. CENA-BCM004]MDN4074022.1 hypothetical protein [Fictibacillus sp. CENA-BCM004]